MSPWAKTSGSTVQIRSYPTEGEHLRHLLTHALCAPCADEKVASKNQEIISIALAYRAYGSPEEKGSVVLFSIFLQHASTRSFPAPEDRPGGASF